MYKSSWSDIDLGGDDRFNPQCEYRIRVKSTEGFGSFGDAKTYYFLASAVSETRLAFFGIDNALRIDFLRRKPFISPAHVPVDDPARIPATWSSSNGGADRTASVYASLPSFSTKGLTLPSAQAKSTRFTISRLIKTRPAVSFEKPTMVPKSKP